MSGQGSAIKTAHAVRRLPGFDHLRGCAGRCELAQHSLRAWSAVLCGDHPCELLEARDEVVEQVRGRRVFLISLACTASECSATLVPRRQIWLVLRPR